MSEVKMRPKRPSEGLRVARREAADGVWGLWFGFRPIPPVPVVLCPWDCRPACDAAVVPFGLGGRLVRLLLAAVGRSDSERGACLAVPCCMMRKNVPHYTNVQR